MSLEFRIGGRVVCIRDDKFNRNWGPPAPDAKMPVKGCIYTIEDIRPIGNVIWFAIVELKCSNIAGLPVLFASVYFRPVRETSIDCFTALLEKPPVRLREDA
jgi:hypothetical protein